MEQCICRQGGDWKEANLLQATQGERGCVACHHLTCLHHIYIMVHITIISQRSHCLTLTPLPRSVILYWPKNAQGPRQRVQGEAFEPVGAVLSPHTAWRIMWLPQWRRRCFPLSFIFFTSYFSIGKNITSQECYFLLATILLTCFVAPCSEFLFLFLPAFFSNEVGTLCCRSSSGWAVAS